MFIQNLEGYNEAFATKRNDVYWIKTLRSKYQDFQVENITMGLSILLYIFYIIFYLNTAFRTLIVVIVIIIITIWRKLIEMVKSKCFSVNCTLPFYFFFPTGKQRNSAPWKYFLILFHSQQCKVWCKWQI